ncbi:hypothetical protein E4U43_001159 [Claviceps pusilla]|uniref:Uncharacterized protein n=1 Tax=Claviceps pusilla TaxID=123648 RepID=A0A9P7N8J5_9HYPO|nr:hypothetical protein E4U43_001159 [Claviceps pusilla]
MRPSGRGPSLPWPPPSSGRVRRGPPWKPSSPLRRWSWNPTRGGASPAVGAVIKPKTAGAASATHCAFTSGGVVPGGTSFTTYSPAQGCLIPHGVAGVTYLFLSKAAPLDGVLTDEDTIAGPIFLGL